MTEAMLPCCTATNTNWRRYSYALSSPVTKVMWQAISFKRKRASGPIVLHCHQHKKVSRLQGGILGMLLVFSVHCYCSRLSGCKCPMRWGESVHTCSIPNQYLALLPWHHRSPIRALAIQFIETRWFQMGWDFGWTQSTLEYVINGSMSGVAALAKAAAQTMDPEASHLSTTRGTCMWVTHGYSQMKADSNAYYIIIHPETNRR